MTSKKLYEKMAYSFAGHIADLCEDLAADNSRFKKELFVVEIVKSVVDEWDKDEVIEIQGLLQKALEGLK